MSTTPPKSAELVNLRFSTTEEKDLVKTLVKIELHNPGRFQGEYATTIRIPDGMFVSGYWLHIGDQRVPGKIFERKTAMWVYRMIRDATRRDPGLLTYLGPNELSLRVFPLAANETRFTEIEFLSPDGFDRTIAIGERTITGDTATESRIVTTNYKENASCASLNEVALRSLPEVTRTPYLHFIVDRSITGLKTEDFPGEIDRVRQKFPDLTEAKLTFANYEFHDANNGDLISLSQINTGLIEPKLPLRGRFMTSRVLKRNLSRYSHNQSPKCPLFVILAGTGTETKVKDPPTWLTEALPDFGGFFVKRSGSPVKAYQFDGFEWGTTLEQRKVHLLKSGNVHVAIPSSTSTASLEFPGHHELQVFDPETGSYQPLPITDSLPDSSLYSKAAAGWALNSETAGNPSKTDQLLPEIVKMSRDSGILLPDTAYIVVENSAQWKILKQKEKKKLKGNHALDHMETPEPYWWLFLLAYLLYILFKYRVAFRARR
jgi:hypothetical protein